MSEEKANNPEVNPAENTAVNNAVSQSNESPIILIVEDNNLQIRTYQQMFKGSKDLQKYKLVVANDGNSALQILQASKKSDKPVLILLDSVMTGLSGPSFLVHIKKDARWNKIPVIMASSNGGREAVVDAYSKGAADYIIKPIEVNLLIIKINKILNKVPDKTP